MFLHVHRYVRAQEKAWKDAYLIDYSGESSETELGSSRTFSLFYHKNVLALV